MTDDRLIRLFNGNGQQVAVWKLGEFPDWLATHLNTLPNESAVFRYSIKHDGEALTVHPGPLAIEVHHVLLKLGMSLQERDQVDMPVLTRRYPCTECGRGLSESRAIKGYNCPEHVDHVLMRARTAHDAYAKAIGHMPNGADVDFDRLTDRQRDAWRAAAAAVIEDVS